MRVPLLSTRDTGFPEAFARLLDRSQAADPTIATLVGDILADVRRRGDAAVLDYTRRFDAYPINTAADLAVPPARLKAALAALTSEHRTALEAAAARVRSYHEKQKTESWRNLRAGWTRGVSVLGIDERDSSEGCGCR